MSEPAIDPQRKALLRKFESRKDGRVSAADLKKFAAATPGKSPGLAIDPTGLDRALSGLIADGLIAVTGAAKEGDHPRPKGSYRLTAEGERSLLPGRPDHEDELLGYQASFLLLQLFRAEHRTLSRSKLNEKLKSVAAAQNLEFDPKGSPETIGYHLNSLVEAGHVEQERRGNAHNFRLTEAGLAALAGARQHQAATFAMTGATLNDLLDACRGTRPIAEHGGPDEPGERDPRPELATITAGDILELVEGLKAGDYEGEELIPIPALRKLVADRHGAEAASHPVFDRLLKAMWGDGELRLTSIGNLADATEADVAAAIPGANETIFYVMAN